jgi:hypothetical protein
VQDDRVPELHNIYILRKADVRTIYTGDERQSPNAPAATSDDVPRGILFMVAATGLLSLSSALAKWLVALYPVGEVMFFSLYSFCLSPGSPSSQRSDRAPTLRGGFRSRSRRRLPF